jgi:hypothetical protein
MKKLILWFEVIIYNIKEFIKRIIYRLFYDVIYEVTFAMMDNTQVYVLVFFDDENDNCIVQNWTYFPTVNEKVLLEDKLYIITEKKFCTKIEAHFNVQMIENK